MPGPRQDQLRERVEAANQARADAYRSEFDWSDADWNQALQKSMRPESRQVQGYDAMGRPAQLHEYLVNGKWYNQQEYDDPLMRQNVINPWMDSVRNDWRIKREKAMKDKEAYDQGGAMPSFGGYRGRGGGSVGSYSGGGGGGMGSRTSRRPQYDPQMIQQLIGG